MRLMASVFLLGFVACADDSSSPVSTPLPAIPDARTGGNDAQLSDAEPSIADASREVDVQVNVADQGDTDWPSGPSEDSCGQFPPVTNGFQTGSGTNFGDVAGDFTVQQLDGSDWTFSEKWTGCESYVFFTFFNLNANVASASEALWESRLDELFRKADRNVRYFFMSDESDESARVARLTALRARLLERMRPRLSDESELIHWANRFHFVTNQARSIPGSLGDFLNAYLRYASSASSGVDLGDRGTAYPPLPNAFGIDRFQRFDPVGSLSLAVGQPSALSMAAYTAGFYNHMGKLYQALIDDPPLHTVSLLSGAQTERHFTVPIDLPADVDWETITRAEVEIQVHCPAMNPFACSEWDRIGRIELCRDVECTQKDEIARWITPYWRRGTRRWFLDVSPFVALLSQPNLQLEEPVPEGGTAGTAGTAGDGGAGGVEMPVNAGGSGESGEAGAQTQGGQSGASGSAGTETPEAGSGGAGIGSGGASGGAGIGSGGVSGMEEAMVPDARRFMRLIMGPNWERKTERNVEIKLHLWAVMQPKPKHVFPLFRGGSFNPDFDSGRPTVELELPPGINQAKLIYILSGHGQDGDNACAEWCAHKHIFSVNGTENLVEPSSPRMTSVGCAELTGQGVVPGQWGNWNQGRAYWCPGLPVPNLEIDVSTQITPGAVNLFEHRANGPSGSLTGGNIDLSSYLVVY
ncbi:MAG: peptide-N-glycosidase F-related protein [Bradymonadia bacterium]